MIIHLLEIRKRVMEMNITNKYSQSERVIDLIFIKQKVLVICNGKQTDPTRRPSLLD